MNLSRRLSGLHLRALEISIFTMISFARQSERAAAPVTEGLPCGPDFQIDSTSFHGIIAPMRELTKGEEFYDGAALLGDPVHGYISFTTPRAPGEKTEKDSSTRRGCSASGRIYQLQSARWVYPSAEHSRFQHSLGAMHLAGKFAHHLYPSLKAAVPDCPSLPFIEEVLRVAGLIHDIGHGPFGHFFDDNFSCPVRPYPREGEAAHHQDRACGHHQGDPPQPVGRIP